ncbi:hypothetical protein PCASD_18704 [Puccinia coronata f. sp. avenae]|nr:hypothetical protein PCASD_18704 [Puccinia coronata f. sp. avenae]
MCSFGALTKVEGAQPMEIEDDLAGSNLSSHLDWGVADQATSHSMSHHQVRESGPGKRSRDEDAMMADQSSSSAPSAEGIGEKRRKLDLEDETSARCKKIVEDLQSWRSELLESGLSEASGRSHVNQQLDIAMNAAKKLFEARLYELRGNSYSFEGSRTDLLEKNMESTKRRWLDSVLQVMQAFPMPKGKLSPSIIQEGYRIMDMLLKDVMRLGLLSETLQTFATLPRKKM